MENSSSKKIPPLTKEQIWRLYQLSLMSDDEIDFSDIPEITDEEWRTRFKPVRLRQKNSQIAGQNIMNDSSDKKILMAKVVEIFFIFS